MFVQISGNAKADLQHLKAQTENHWRNKSSWYWLWRLIQEVNELFWSLIGVHKHSPQHELLQIASICWNWVEMIYSKKK